MEIQEENVVIVGAGVAGLATALALKKIGIQSLVLERSHKLRATGAALSLSANAWLALDALGVSEKLTSIYTPFQKGSVTNITAGTVQEVFYTKLDGKSTGLRTVHRSALLETLAAELSSDAIRFSSTLNSIDNVQDGESSFTILRLADGTIIRAQVVIGCDGVHSVVGRWLGLKAPIHSGRATVRGFSTFNQGHGFERGYTQFVHGSVRAGFAPLTDTELYWFVTYKSPPEKDTNMKFKSPEQIQKSILQNIADFPSILLNVVQQSDVSTVTSVPLWFRAPWDLLLSQLYKGNITVAGDAMHPTTPDLGQGGCAALEDAIILARHIRLSIELNGKVDSRAFKGYVEERRWRAAMLISASYLTGWIQQGGSGWLKEFLRDAVFYKILAHFASRIERYNCGKLPGVSWTAKGNTPMKLE